MSLIQDLEFGDVKDDKDFVTKSIDLNNNLIHLAKHLEHMKSINVDSLSIEERINYSLFTMYAISSMCWIRLRLKGIDPNGHPVKQQLLRIRQLMKTRDDIIAKKSKPSLDKDAAKRFIRSGLWDPKNREQMPPNKKIKFSDD